MVSKKRVEAELASKLGNMKIPSGLRRGWIAGWTYKEANDHWSIRIDLRDKAWLARRLNIEMEGWSLVNKKRPYS